MSAAAFSRRAIEWRHAWPVRFAHHPLCARHRHETWRIGRLNLCRGCASLATGLVGGSIALIAAGGAWTALASALLLPVVLLLSWPAWYRRLPRPLRDFLRVALGLVIATGAHAIFSAPMTLWPFVPLAAVAWWLFRRQRIRVNARRCDGCPELGRGVCSGYAEHARAMRAIAAEIESHLLDDDQLVSTLLAARAATPTAGVAVRDGPR